VLPADHLAFFRQLEASFSLGDYFFAHAGARPGLPLDEQAERDLYWIREPFLSDPRPFDKMIVHGHSADVAIHSDNRRIGIDTGAYATGQLTALRLEGEGRAFLFTRNGSQGLEVGRQS
jgi:serine/threonine protein phosphatase 1